MVDPSAPACAPQAEIALPASVVKRDGRLVPFDAQKIASAIERAGAASGQFAAAEANRLAVLVTRTLAARTGTAAPEIEAIQDLV